MATTIKYNKQQSEFVAVLQPILDHWKDHVNEAYEIKPFTENSVRISRPEKHLQTIHGLLLNRVSQACLTRGWTWSVWSQFGELILIVQP